MTCTTENLRLHSHSRLNVVIFYIILYENWQKDPLTYRAEGALITFLLLCDTEYHKLTIFGHRAGE